jgi:large subunit ribosomal protein L32
MDAILSVPGRFLRATGPARLAAPGYHPAPMAVPKKRQSRTRRDKRRAQHQVSAPRLNECPRCHSPRLPHRVCPTCGTYAGREVIRHEEPETAAPSAGQASPQE